MLLQVSVEFKQKSLLLDINGVIAQNLQLKDKHPELIWANIIQTVVSSRRVSYQISSLNSNFLVIPSQKPGSSEYQVELFLVCRMRMSSNAGARRHAGKIHEIARTAYCFAGHNPFEEYEAMTSMRFGFSKS
jgi:hypothetical protein